MKNRKSASASKCFVLKGGLYTLTTLHLQNYDSVALNEQLAATVARAPKFFDHTPVVVDLQTLAENTVIDMAELASNLRTHHLIPVGIRGGNEAQRQEALKANWAVLPETTKNDNTSPVAAPKHTLTKLITQPVRSGQQIYAQGGDLIVLAPVSAGAEILADGHIHVYAPLRGRALAGVLGNTEARIFCQHLEAELIAIAGNYKVSEQLKDHIRAWEKSVSIYLTDEHLTIQSL